MSHGDHDFLPHWSWLVPVFAGVFIGLKLAGILPSGSAVFLALAALFLAAAIFAAVHHAESLALWVGDPMGSILLALAVVILEVALIASLMLSGAEGSEQVARDTVFSTIMIVLNGVIGLCLVLGGSRYGEQSFQLNSASTALAVLGSLATLTLVLPNFTVSGDAQQFSSVQMQVVGLICLIVYAVFLFIQSFRHRDYFIDSIVPAEDGASHEPAQGPSRQVAALSGVLLIGSLVAVVVLAKELSYPLDAAVDAAGLPQAFVGVVIAAVILLPEGMASVRSALKNRLQNSVNLGLGSALASIGLTIPVVAIISIAADVKLTLGLSSENVLLLVLTLFVSTITLGTGRTTVLQGTVHLGIFAVFLLLSAVP